MKITKFNPTICLFFLLITFFIFALFFNLNPHRIDSLSCDGNINIYGKKSEVKVKINILINGQSGVLTTNGTVLTGDDIYRISRRSIFTLSEIKKNTILYFNAIEIGGADEVSNVQLVSELPDFISKQKSSLLLLIYKNGKDYIAESNNLPSFYCNSGHIVR